MPNIKSVMKNDVKSKLQNAKNKAEKTAMKTSLKKFDAAINAGDEPVKLDVKAVEARLGGTARVLSTGKDGLQAAPAPKKPLSIAQNDGAVLVINLSDF